MKSRKSTMAMAVAMLISAASVAHAASVADQSQSWPKTTTIASTSSSAVNADTHCLEDGRVSIVGSTVFTCHDGKMVNVREMNAPMHPKEIPVTIDLTITRAGGEPHTISFIVQSGERAHFDDTEEIPYLGAPGGGKVAATPSIAEEEALTTGLSVSAAPAVMPDGKVELYLRVTDRHLESLGKSADGKTQEPVVSEDGFEGQSIFIPGAPTLLLRRANGEQQMELTVKVKVFDDTSVAS